MTNATMRDVTDATSSETAVDKTMERRYRAAVTMDEFVAQARENQELFRAVASRVVIPGEFVARLAHLAAPRHLLVLLEDWCGDAVNTVPVVAALAELAPQLDLRVLARDANPDLMDAHLTGTSRSIPVVIVLDEHYRELGWWGPRPAELQAWALSAGRALEKAERYKEIRRWYARDRGRSTLEEVVSLIENSDREP